MKAITIREHDFFGTHFELNPLGEKKVCSFDCAYCNLGPSTLKINELSKYGGFPKVADLVNDFASSITNQMKVGGQPIETLVISGNGEPTLFPGFPLLVSELLKKRQELMLSGLKIVCLTNGECLSNRQIVSALNKLDQTFVKLDFGGEIPFAQFNRPRTRTSLAKVIAGARGLTNLSIQTVVLAGDASLDSPTRLDDWLEVVAMLNPHEVLLSLGHHPFRDPEDPIAGLEMATEEDLLRLSHWLDRRLKIKARTDSSSAA